MKKTDRGGFQPQLCILHSALCTIYNPNLFIKNKNFKKPIYKSKVL